MQFQSCWHDKKKWTRLWEFFSSEKRKTSMNVVNIYIGLFPSCILKEFAFPKTFSSTIIQEELPIKLLALCPVLATLQGTCSGVTVWNQNQRSMCQLVSVYSKPWTPWAPYHRIGSLIEIKVIIFIKLEFSMWRT